MVFLMSSRLSPGAAVREMSPETQGSTVCDELSSPTPTLSSGLELAKDYPLEI